MRVRRYIVVNTTEHRRFLEHVEARVAQQFPNAEIIGRERHPTRYETYVYRVTHPNWDDVAPGDVEPEFDIGGLP